MTTANERFKQLATRFRWFAALFAVAVHAAVLFLMPPFTVDLSGTSGSSMVLRLSGWAGPSVSVDVPDRYVALDTTAMPRPRLANGEFVQHRIPRVYPWLMWHHREPSTMRVQLAVAPSGRVREVIWPGP